VVPRRATGICPAKSGLPRLDASLQAMGKGLAYRVPVSDAVEVSWKTVPALSAPITGPSLGPGTRFHQAFCFATFRRGVSGGVGGCGGGPGYPSARRGALKILYTPLLFGPCETDGDDSNSNIFPLSFSPERTNTPG